MASSSNLFFRLFNFQLNKLKMKISINKEKCIGCGACEAICSKVFVMKNGKAEAKVKESKEACVKEAADSCPLQAISVK